MRRKLVSYWELPKEWQGEAKRNNEQDYQDLHYILPLPEHNPTEHVLYDSSQWSYIRDMGGLVVYGEAISNNSCIKVYIDSDASECVLTYNR